MSLPNRSRRAAALPGLAWALQAPASASTLRVACEDEGAEVSLTYVVRLGNEWVTSITTTQTPDGARIRYDSACETTKLGMLRNKGTAALGGLFQLEHEGSNMRVTTTEILGVAGQPFPWVADRKFAMTYRTYAKADSVEYRFTVTRTCAAGEAAQTLPSQPQLGPVWPVFCILRSVQAGKSDGDAFYRLLPQYWHAPSGGFVGVGS